MTQQKKASEMTFAILQFMQTDECDGADMYALKEFLKTASIESKARFYDILKSNY